MCERPETGWLECVCGDPTCIRGAVPWLPCQNPDQLIDRMLRRRDADEILADYTGASRG